jgi:hypothetical protein
MVLHLAGAAAWSVPPTSGAGSTRRSAKMQRLFPKLIEARHPRHGAAPAPRGGHASGQARHLPRRRRATTSTPRWMGARDAGRRFAGRRSGLPPRSPPAAPRARHDPARQPSEPGDEPARRRPWSCAAPASSRCRSRRRSSRRLQTDGLLVFERAHPDRERAPAARRRRGGACRTHRLGQGAPRRSLASGSASSSSPACPAPGRAGPSSASRTWATTAWTTSRPR